MTFHLFTFLIQALKALSLIRPLLSLYRDARAGGRPWSSAGGPVTQPTRKWSRWARRRRASSSLSSAEGGGGVRILAAPPPPTPPVPALLLPPPRACSTGTSHQDLQKSSVYTVTLWDCRIGHFESLMRLDTAANDTKTWETPEDWSQTNPLFSSCWQGTDLLGTEWGNSNDVIDSVSIG